MTPTTRKALEMAREALEYHTQQTRPISRTEKAIVAITEALAEPQVLWTGCVFSGSPPEQNRPMCGFVNAPVKSGVAISRLDLVARVEAAPSKDIIGSARMTAQVNTEKQHSVPMTELTGPLRPVPRRLTHEDILDVWSKYNPLADWSYVGFGRAVEARIFGDVK